MTPRQQKEARLIVKALLRYACATFRAAPDESYCVRIVCGSDCRSHNRARLFLRQTAPKPARRKKA